jgi:hypothetical protein
MADIPRTAKNPELAFTYMVFQSWLDKNFLFFYMDGSSSRRTMGIPAFMKMVQEKFPQLLHDAHEACKTTSFYLLDSTVPMIKYLSPLPNDALYVDSIRELVDSKKTGKEPKHFAKGKQNVNDMLNSYGFAPVTQQSIDNLTVSIKKNDDVRQGFLSRFLNRGKN